MDDVRRAPGPGWHPDPWFSGQRRWWDGGRWTADVFPDAPGGARPQLRAAGERPAAPPPVAPSGYPPPAPVWGYDDQGWRQPEPTPVTSVFPPAEEISGAPAPGSTRRVHPGAVKAAALVIGLVAGFAIVDAARGHHDATTPPSADAPFTQPSSPSASPSGPPAAVASALQRIVVQSSDVPSGQTVTLLPGGTDPKNQPTLDLCNGTYPSESRRTSRLQVAAATSTGDVALSTEAVQYDSAAGTQQAFAELAKVARSCPNAPVTSPVGEPTVTTKFGASPDKGWPTVSGVQRQAYAITTTEDDGTVTHSTAVYLRRGRILEGVYLTDGAGASVGGATSPAAIVAVFEKRIAALPASAVG